MFGSFRKHQKWIWMLGVIIIVPSFVIFFTPDVERRFDASNAPQYDFGSVNGRPITREQFLQCLNETRISYFVRSGGRNWPDNDESMRKNLERDSISRVLMVEKMKELGIEVSPKGVARLASQQLRDYPLKQFEADVLRPQGLTAADYERYLTHEVGIQQLVNVAAASGKLVNPGEAEILFRKENENFHTEAAVFWASNYLDKVVATPQAVGRYYTNQMARYRIPDRIRVSYVEFVASNYLSEAETVLNSNTNLNEIIDELYRRQGAEFFKDTNNVTLSEEAAKAKIKEDEKQRLALREARKKANELGTELLNLPQPNKADDLDKLAAARGYVVKVTDPFNMTTGLEEGGFPTEFRQNAMRLNTQTPLQIQPIVGEKAAYVIAFKEEIKGEMPPLEQVVDKVTEDYKIDEARNMARSMGNSFYRTMTNGLAVGKSFADICTQANAERVSLPVFTPSDRPPLEGLDAHFNLNLLQRYAGDLEPGKGSNFLPARDGGFVLYLKEKTPVEDAKLKDELPAFVDQLRQYRQGQAFDAWFRKQVEQSRLTLPNRETEKPADTTAPPPAAGS